MQQVAYNNTFAEPFRFVNALQKQAHRNTWCCDAAIVNPLCTPKGKLPRFQLTVLGPISSIDDIEVYDYTERKDDVIATVINNTAFLETWDETGTSYEGEIIRYTYRGIPIAELEDLSCTRDYYLKINFADERSYFSEVFRFYEECCLHLLEWSDTCPIGGTNYVDTGTTHYKQLYLKNCELVSDIRKQEEESDIVAAFVDIVDEIQVDSWLLYEFPATYDYMKAVLYSMCLHEFRRFFHSNGIFFDILDVELAVNALDTPRNCFFNIDITMLQGFVGEKSACCFIEENYQSASDFNIEPAYAGCDGDGSGPCPPPLGVTIEVGLDQATISYTPASQATSIQYTFDLNAPWITPPSNPFTIFGLLPCTDYTIYIKSICDSEESAIQSYNFTTTSQECPAPTNLIATPSTNEIVLNWTPAVLPPVVTGQKLEWRAVGDISWNSISLAPAVNNYTITGLDSSTQYQIRLQSLCDDNCEKVSEFVTITAQTDDCLIDLIITTIDDCDAGTANVTIEALNTTGNYTITVSDGVNSFPVNNTDFVTDLSAGLYSVMIEDEACSISTTFAIVLTCECEAPTGLEVIFIGDDTMTLQWNAVPNAVTYCLEYRSAANMIWTPITDLVTNGVSVTNLDPCTEYEFRVKAKCEDETESDYSNIVIATTTGCPSECDITINSIVVSDCDGNDEATVTINFTALNTVSPNVIVDIDNGTTALQQSVLATSGTAVFAAVNGDGSTYNVNVVDELDKDCIASDSFDVPNCEDPCGDCEGPIVFSNIVVVDSNVPPPNEPGNGSVSFDVSGCGDNYTIIAIFRNLCDLLRTDGTPGIGIAGCDIQQGYWQGGTSAILTPSPTDPLNAFVIIGGSSFFIDGLNKDNSSPSQGTEYTIVVQAENGCTENLQFNINQG